MPVTPQAKVTGTVILSSTLRRITSRHHEQVPVTSMMAASKNP